VPTWAPRCHRNIGRLPTARPRSTCCEIIHQRKPRHRLQLTVVIGDPLRGSVPIEYLASISDSVTGIQLTIELFGAPGEIRTPDPLVRSYISPLLPIAPDCAGVCSFNGLFLGFCFVARTI